MRITERLAAGALALVLAGCGLFADASIQEMIPGGNVGSGELECWLTLQFDAVPEGADPRDVEVRFESVALEEPARFSWEFIAEHDSTSGGSAFGSGRRTNTDTTAETSPPLGQALEVKFPLRARRVIEDPTRLVLRADLYWGGERQDSMERSIEHVYAEEGPYAL